ncbi:MAG TPA: glycosyltransferase family 2 protein [Vicinamibacterales bacterium]|nr:glycosyltransferase family 2 protein [Vicinamibacterales bacterium]
MTLSIVIVAFNARADLERCLMSLHDAPPSVAHDITVVDNASTDGGIDLVRTRWPGVGILALPENRGFAAANNAGIRATRGEMLLLLNSDTVVPAGAIDTLVRKLIAHPEAAAAGPRLVDGDGRAEISFGPMISPVAELRQKIIGRLYAARAPLVTGQVDRLSHTEHYVDWVSGACLVVRRADAVAVGLLDERFFLYTEDVDFCASLRARGRKILFVADAEVVHLRGRSRASAPRAASAAYRRSHIAFYEKHHPRWAPLLKAYLRVRGELP